MTVQVELWQLMGFLVALVAAIVGAVWKMGSLLIAQIDKRIEERSLSQSNAIANLHALANKTDRDLLLLRAELPNQYVLREDWIRFSGTIDKKLDGVHQRLDTLNEKIHART